jgi:transcriptional regulator with XRE-family HTH domain
MNMPDYNQIGQRIRERRLAAGLTQEQLAEAAGVGVQHMSKIENGGTKLSLPCLMAVANAMDVTVDSLLMDNITASRPDMIRELEDSIFADCSTAELAILKATVTALKRALHEQK